MKTRPSFSWKTAGGRIAFTLMELIISITLVGILATLIMVSMGRLRQTGQRTTSTNDLRTSSLALLAMAQDEGGMFKVWVGGTTGTGGAWPVMLYNKGYTTDARVFYGTPRQPGVERPAPNWYLYTWGMNLDDPRAMQRLNSVADGYQIRLSVVDNPANTMLLSDSILASTATSQNVPARQTFRILSRQGVDGGTSSGLRTRDGRTVLMSFFDGHLEQADFPRLYQIGFRRVIDETGKTIAIPAL